MTDYHTDFLTNLQEIVGRIEACDTTPEREANNDAWRRMERLYGPRVFPARLLDLLNCGLRHWRHRPGAAVPAAAAAPAAAAGAPGAAARAPGAAFAPEAAAAAAEAPEDAGAQLMQEVRDELLRVLRKRLLVVDESPTLTRMFTFAGHIDGLLLMSFLECFNDLIHFARRSGAGSVPEAHGEGQGVHASAGDAAVSAADVFVFADRRSCHVFVLPAT